MCLSEQPLSWRSSQVLLLVVLDIDIGIEVGGIRIPTNKKTYPVRFRYLIHGSFRFRSVSALKKTGMLGDGGQNTFDNIYPKFNILISICLDIINRYNIQHYPVHPNRYLIRYRYLIHQIFCSVPALQTRGMSGDGRQNTPGISYDISKVRYFDESKNGYDTQHYPYNPPPAPPPKPHSPTHDAVSSSHNPQRRQQCFLKHELVDNARLTARHKLVPQRRLSSVSPRTRSRPHPRSHSCNGRTRCTRCRRCSCCCCCCCCRRSRCRTPRGGGAGGQRSDEATSPPRGGSGSGVVGR